MLNWRVSLKKERIFPFYSFQAAKFMRPITELLQATRGLLEKEDLINE
jgi:hypothetical protein